MKNPIQDSFSGYNSFDEFTPSQRRKGRKIIFQE
jgi:hypothetical protein